MLISLFTASLALAAEGSGKATVVWLQPDLPPAELRAKAEKLLGTSAVHAAWSDLAFTPTPFTKDDEARLASLERAKTDARIKFDSFDTEREIAAALGAAVGAVTVVRNDADRKALAEALVLQGAAVTRIVPEERFATAEDVGAWRTYFGSSAVVKPYVDALALEPNAAWIRDDLPDANGFARLNATRDEAAAQANARVELAALPVGLQVVLDGRPWAPDATSQEVEPGHHYLHVVVGERIVGRQAFDVAAGAVVTIEPTVSKGELEAARARMLEESKAVPEDVARAVDTVGLRNGAPTPTFLATLDDKGRLQVLPYGGGASFEKRPAVTVLLNGSVGGAYLLSPAFLDTIGTPTSGFGVAGDLGVEIGIYNLAVYGGTTLTLTPTQRMQYANGDSTANIDTNAYFHPYGGLGVYLPRPDAKKPLLLLGANYGWFSPGAMGVGGRISFGIPSGDGTWFRIDLDAFRGTQQAGFPAEGEASLYAGLRLGFGRKL
ncbi:MAG: hypothetical protein Q8P41_04625 [Pseudomonadota bacterium]|nr:hypothetical protein [Pseudomonadota bacterium]